VVLFNKAINTLNSALSARGDRSVYKGNVDKAAQGLLDTDVHRSLLIDLHLQPSDHPIKQAVLNANLSWIDIVGQLVHDGKLPADAVARHLLVPTAEGTAIPPDSRYLRHPMLGSAYMKLLSTVSAGTPGPLGVQIRVHAKMLAGQMPVSPQATEDAQGSASAPAMGLHDLVQQACNETSIQQCASVEAWQLKQQILHDLPSMITNSEREEVAQLAGDVVRNGGARKLARNPSMSGAASVPDTAEGINAFLLERYEDVVGGTRRQQAGDMADARARDYVEWRVLHPDLGDAEWSEELERRRVEAKKSINEMVHLFHPDPEEPLPSIEASAAVLPAGIEGDAARQALPMAGPRIVDAHSLAVQDWEGAGSLEAGVIETEEGVRWRVKNLASSALSHIEVAMSRMLQLTGLHAADTALVSNMRVDDDAPVLVDAQGMPVAETQQAGATASPPAQMGSRLDENFEDLGRYLLGPQAADAVDESAREAYLALQREHDALNRQTAALLEEENVTHFWKLRDDQRITQHAGLHAQCFALLEQMNRMLPAPLRAEQLRHYIVARFLANWDQVNPMMDNFGFTQVDGATVGMTVDFGSCGPLGFRDRHGTLQPKQRSVDIAMGQRPASLAPMSWGDDPQFDTFTGQAGLLRDTSRWPYGAQSSSIAELLEDPAMAGVVAEMGYRLQLMPMQAMEAMLQCYWQVPADDQDWPDVASVLKLLEQRRNAMVTEIGVSAIAAWVQADPERAQQVRHQIERGIVAALDLQPGELPSVVQDAIGQAHQHVQAFRPLPELLQTVPRSERSRQVLNVAEALQALIVDPDRCRTALLDDPAVLIGLARVLQRQNDQTEPKTTQGLAHVAAVALSVAADRQLQLPEGDRVLAEALAGTRKVAEPTGFRAGLRTLANAVAGMSALPEPSAISASLVGRGRQALAAWSHLVLRELPDRIKATPGGEALAKWPILDEMGGATPLAKVLAKRGVDGPVPSIGLQADQRTLAAVQDAVQAIRELQPAQSVKDEAAQRESDRIAAVASRRMELSEDYQQREAERAAKKKRDAAFGDRSLQEHMAGNEAHRRARPPQLPKHRRGRMTDAERARRNASFDNQRLAGLSTFAHGQKVAAAIKEQKDHVLLQRMNGYATNIGAPVPVPASVPLSTSPVAPPTESAPDARRYSTISASSLQSFTSMWDEVERTTQADRRDRATSLERRFAELRSSPGPSHSTAPAPSPNLDLSILDNCPPVPIYVADGPENTDPATNALVSRLVELRDSSPADSPEPVRSRKKRELAPPLRRNQ